MDAGTEVSSLKLGTSQSRHVRDFIVDFIAGAAGGAACVYCGQPLDTIKVKMQTFPEYYKSGFDCFKEVLKSEGIRGLYRGSVPALMCNVAENSVLFMALGFGKKIVGTLSNTDHTKLSSFQTACAGSIAALVSSLVVCPAELIKCRMQGMTELAAAGKVSCKSLGPLGVTKQIVRERGPMGLMMGISSTCAREIPGYFAVFYSYDQMKSLVTPKGKTKDEIGPLGLMFAGGTAGIFFWLAVYPIDVVKSRIQVLSVTGKTPGFLAMLLNVVQKEGFLKLYSGLKPCLLRSYPANGALFFTYEFIQKLLRDF